jgi:hypothetical protein
VAWGEAVAELKGLSGSRAGLWSGLEHRRASTIPANLITPASASVPGSDTHEDPKGQSLRAGTRVVVG